jgi:aspartate/methionine/tyrosine aminotransferase
MNSEILNFAFGTNELPELREWQEKWKRATDQEDIYSIVGFHGLAALQKKIHERFIQRTVKGGCSSRQVMVTAGGTEALFTSLLWLKSINGSVLLQHPSWGYMTDTLELLQIPYSYSRATDAESLKKDLALVEKGSPTLFLLTHPSNPFSYVFPSSYLRVLSEWVHADENHYVLSDEIYDWFVGKEEDYISWASFHGLQQSIIVHGYSKPTGLAAFRIGYLLADSSVYKKIFPFHYSSSYGATIYSQFMALHAQEDEMKLREVLRLGTDRSWKIIKEEWQDSRVMSLQKRRSGMYANFVIDAPVDEQSTFFSQLKSQAKVIVTPGDNFGVEAGGFRLNICRPPDQLEEGIRRIQEFTKTHFKD